MSSPTRLPSGASSAPSTVVSRRTLNRTLLERQFLLDRSPGPALDVVERLVALQAQEPNAPYVGLWTRTAGFTREDLAALLHDRRVVRSTLLRGTQHLSAAETFRWLRPALQPVMDRWTRSRYYTEQISGLEPAALAAAGRELLADGPLQRRRLARLLVERFPGRRGGVLATAVELLVPLVHEPPNSAWGSWGNRGGIQVGMAATSAAPPASQRRSQDVPQGLPPVEALVRRYLAAFGPASVKDLQAWCGLTRLRTAVDELRPRLRVLRDEEGRELFDLPELPLADAGTPAPVRFLPPYDNLLLGHSDRTRVISDADRKQVMPGYSLVHPTFLLDGFVRGTWEPTEAALRISPFRPLSDAEAQAVLDEAVRLRSFLVQATGAVAGGAAEPEIVFT